MPAPDPGQQRGDRDAFLRHLPDVLPALTLWARLRIHGRLRQRLDPEDLVQESCVRAFAGFGAFDEHRGSFRAWMFGVANHVLLQELRGMKKTGAAFDSDLRLRSEDLDAISASQTSITSAVAKMEQLAALTAEIQELTDADRWILIYRGLEEHGYDEVAKRLQLHPEAVRTRWRRILTKLRYSKGLVRFVDDRARPRAPQT